MPITTVIPITIIILLHYNYSLVGRLRNAESINEILRNKKHSSGESLTLEDENNHRKVFVTLESLLYIRAADNYIDIYYIKESDKITHELIRNSLANIEKSFEHTKLLFRCHKSFIVNLNMVMSVTGNTAGYKLKLKDTDTLIPVSRKLNNRIVEIFND